MKRADIESEREILKDVDKCYEELAKAGVTERPKSCSHCKSDQVKPSSTKQDKGGASLRFLWQMPQVHQLRAVFSFPALQSNASRDLRVPYSVHPTEFAQETDSHGSKSHSWLGQDKTGQHDQCVFEVGVSRWCLKQQEADSPE